MHGLHNSYTLVHIYCKKSSELQFKFFQKINHRFSTEFHEHKAVTRG